jgi:hypothetical protein
MCIYIYIIYIYIYIYIMQDNTRLVVGWIRTRVIGRYDSMREGA